MLLLRQSVSLDLGLALGWFDKRLVSPEDSNFTCSEEETHLREDEFAAVWKPRLYFYEARKVSGIKAVSTM